MNMRFDACSWKPALQSFHTTLIKIYFDSSLKLSDLVDDLETTDRQAERAMVAARRRTVADEVEMQEVRAGPVRISRPRPIAAVVADTVEPTINVATTTRSRIPDGLICAELTREVHAFVGAVIWITTKG